MVSSRALVELVLLGPTNDRRQLQDSPVLGDVWIAFATKPPAPRDLLISPYRPRPAGPVAVLLAKRLETYGRPRDSGNEADAAHVAYLQGLVAARLYFSELLEVVVPMTGWWQERQVRTEIAKFTGARLSRIVEVILQWARAASADEQAERASRFGDFTALDRYVALAAIVLWAGTRKADDPDGTQRSGRAARHARQRQARGRRNQRAVPAHPEGARSQAAPRSPKGPEDSPRLADLAQPAGAAGAGQVGGGGEGRCRTHGLQGRLLRDHVGRSRFGHRREPPGVPRRGRDEPRDAALRLQQHPADREPRQPERRGPGVQAAPRCADRGTGPRPAEGDGHTFGRSPRTPTTTGRSTGPWWNRSSRCGRRPS